MKILAVAFCPQFGAIHDIFMQITKDLALNAQVSILCPRNLEKINDRDNHFEKIYMIDYNKKNPISLLSLDSFHVAKEIIDDKFDIVFFFTQHILNIPILFLLRRANVTMWWHEPHKKGRTTFLKYILYVPHDYLLTKKSKQIIVACDAMRLMVPHYLQEKISVISFSSSLLDESLAAGENVEIVRKKFDFLFFGKIESYKGLNILAQAMECLYNRGYQPTLNVIGMGDMSKHCPQLLKLAEAHPQEITITNSFASEELIVAAMDQSRIVVLPYLTATGTTTVQIAYQQHKPVIATQTGCFQNHIIHGETGWLVPPADFLALAEVLKKVLEDPAKTTYMGESAYKYFNDNFTREIVTEKLMKIFADCME